MKQNKTIAIIGAPVDYGSRLRGCLMGPDAMRVAGLVEVLQELGYAVTDYGNTHPAKLSRSVPQVRHVKNLSDSIAWTQSLKETTQEIAKQGHFPLILGGDHSLAMGTVTGLCAHAAHLERPLFILWLDAHTDFNTFETSPSGNIHGMPVSFFCGLPGFDGVLEAELEHKVDPKNICMMGIRSVDDSERKMVNECGITVHDMRAIDEHGVVPPLREFLARVRKQNGLLHLSFDVDFLDPDIAPAVGTQVPGGVTMREAHLIMELVYDSGLLTSMEIAELNPALDHNNKTSRLMVDFIASALGRRVFPQTDNRY